MYKYDITINDWHQSLNYVIKKVYAYDNDRTNCNDTCTANVIRKLCHDRDTYHYPVNKDACSEFNDFLKALCIGYEPAGLTVHPPPQNDRGWVHFFRMGV